MKSIKPAVLASALLLFLLVIYAPLEIYFSNRGDFSFDCFDLLKVMLPLAIILLIICIALFWLLNKRSGKAYKAFVILFTVASLAFFIQGSFLASNLPEMDGEAVDWSAFAYQRPWSIVLWSAAAVLSVVLIYTLKQEVIEKAVSGFCILFLAFLVLTLAIDGITTDGLKAKSDYAVSDLHLMDMSEDENFIIILVDAIDASAFKDVCESHPEYDVQLEDFTFYDNVLSCYPFTSTSVPLILSGEWFHGSTSLGEYTELAFSKSPLFSKLQNEEYVMNLYDSDFAHVAFGERHFANFVRSSRFEKPVNFIIMQAKLVGLRYLPFDLKQYCTLPGYVIDYDSARKIDEGNYYLSDNISLRSAFAASVRTVPEKQFKFIYTEGAHVPFRYDANLNIVEESDYRTCIAASMTLVDEYLCQLKSAGVYDNSVIVIMADHGYFDPLPNMRQNPALLVKGRDEHHPFAVSDAPISHVDLMDAFSNLIDGSTGDQVFPWKAGDSRERIFLWHQYAEPLVEYKTSGHASDCEALVPTGKIYELAG